MKGGQREKKGDSDRDAMETCNEWFPWTLEAFCKLPRKCMDAGCNVGRKCKDVGSNVGRKCMDASFKTWRLSKVAGLATGRALRNTGVLIERNFRDAASWALAIPPSMKHTGETPIDPQFERTMFFLGLSTFCVLLGLRSVQYNSLFWPAFFVILSLLYGGFVAFFFVRIFEHGFFLRPGVDHTSFFAAGAVLTFTIVVPFGRVTDLSSWVVLWYVIAAKSSAVAWWAYLVRSKAEEVRQPPSTFSPFTPNDGPDESDQSQNERRTPFSANKTKTEHVSATTPATDTASHSTDAAATVSSIGTASVATPDMQSL